MRLKNLIDKKINRRLISEDLSVRESLVVYPEKIKDILISRGIQAPKDLDYGLHGLIPPSQLLNTECASAHIFDSIKENKSILIIGDFDADGATSSALMVRALTLFGAKHVDFLVPDRFKFGYGLSEKLVDFAAKKNPDLIITVDNGIANHRGVAKANSYNIPVIITDHHIAAETLPDALAIVNPNQPADDFPSKNLAGVGVAFYLMLALRSLMRSNNWFKDNKIDEPNLAELLDLVALGTVADVVVLDKNNRILVDQGLRRIRAGKACDGINALLDVALKKIDQCRSTDLGFAIGPRLNAAGRLEDMSVGIECLLSDSPQEAHKIASRLDHLNRKRRSIEQDMLQQANQDLAAYYEQQKETSGLSGPAGAKPDARPTTLCLFDPKWHQGVIGILASRVKDRINRPVIVFAKGEQENDIGQSIIKGSARSVQGVHIRDLLALIDSRNPELIIKFGGHAMAAGLSIRESDYEKFATLLHAYADELMGDEKILDEIQTDGNLKDSDFTLSFAKQLKSISPWGQGFPEPLFDDAFEVVSQRIVGEKHLKLILQKGTLTIDAIHFFFNEQLKIEDGDIVHIVYKLDVNEFRGNQSLQLIVDQIEVEQTDQG